VAYDVNASQHALGWATTGVFANSITGQTASMGGFTQDQIAQLQKVEGAQNKTISATDIVASATGGSETLLEAVLRKIGNEDTGTGRIVDAVSIGNLGINNSLTSILAAINKQSEAAASESKRQKDLGTAQAALESVANAQTKVIGEVNTGIKNIWALASAYSLSLQDGAGGAARFAVNSSGQFDATYNSIVGEDAKFKPFKDSFYSAGGVFDQTYGRSGELSGISVQLESARTAVRALGGVPQFSAGTNYLPSDMLAQVHAGERIVPAADNRELMQRLQNPQANNEALIAEIRALRQEVEGLRAEARATASNTGKTAKLISRAMPDGDALNTRTAA
jgi:hypothetical protein